MRILYIIPTLEISGGAERITTEKANYLAERFGYEVFILTIYQHIDKSNYYPLSSKVKQVNLAFPYFHQYKYKYPWRILIKIKDKYSLRIQLDNAVKKINPNIIVGFSYFIADLVCKISSSSPKIIECHEPKNLESSKIYKKTIYSRMSTKFLDKQYYNCIERHADLVVGLTTDVYEQWKNAQKVVVIPNFSSIKTPIHLKRKEKRIIAVGRLNEVKGFERLLDIWSVVSRKHPDWNLNVFGEGKLLHKLNNIIIKEKLRNVSFKGNASNIIEEYSTSSICVVTSHYEGFSLVILEAMSCGLPVVAYDCPYGPRHIIEDNKNGFLVENNNKDLFIRKLLTLMENNSLLRCFSEAAVKRSQAFDKDKIMQQWKSLYEGLTTSIVNHDL